MLELFSKVDSRISRSLLCSTAGIAASRLPPPESPDTLYSCLTEISIVKPALAPKLPESVFTALRTVRGQRLEVKSINPGAAFEQNVMYKLLCMVSYPRPLIFYLAL